MPVPIYPQAPYPFHVMLKPGGAACNLDCSYCYFLKKQQLYPGSSLCMSLETLEEYTRQMLAAQPGPEVVFAWQGGEPTLLGLDFYRQAVSFQQKYRRPGQQISNSFQTNAVLLNEDWAGFFRENNFLVGVSLDGPQPLHDVYRRDKAGRGTFEQVMAGLELLKKGRVNFNILTCVHAANQKQPLEVYRFLRDEARAEFMQFIPIVERLNESGYQEGEQVTARSVGGREYGEFLCAVFDEWLSRDVGRTFVQVFDVALAVWYGQRAGLCIFEPVCGQALALEHNGDLYACDHYVQPDHLLGNILETPLAELAVSSRQQEFGLHKEKSLPRCCRECTVRFICNGGCPRNRIRNTPDGEPGLNYLCEGYKLFFEHIHNPMRKMAAQLRAGQGI